MIYPSAEIPVRTRYSGFEVFLCLSRACLGKIFVFTYKWLEQTVFTPAEVSAADALRSHRACENRHYFLNFSYGYPEPVLVKCIFIYKWRKKWRFSHRTLARW